jgi:hypothetical protein
MTPDCQGGHQNVFVPGNQNEYVKNNPNMENHDTHAREHPSRRNTNRSATRPSFASMNHMQETADTIEAVVRSIALQTANEMGRRSQSDSRRTGPVPRFDHTSRFQAYAEDDDEPVPVRNHFFRGQTEDLERTGRSSRRPSPSTTSRGVASSRPRSPSTSSTASHHTARSHISRSTRRN